LLAIGILLTWDTEVSFHVLIEWNDVIMLLAPHHAFPDVTAALPFLSNTEVML